MGSVLAVPLVGYLLGPVKKDSDVGSWVSLGAADSFPVGETRLVDFQSPVNSLGDGETAKVACWVQARLGKTVSGLRGKLRSSWMSSTLVCAVKALHVSMPWRRLL